MTEGSSPVARQTRPLFGTAASAVELCWQMQEWNRSRNGRLYYDGFQKSLNEREDDQSGSTGVVDVTWASTYPFEEAPLYLVTAEMAEVARHAALTMEDQPLLQSDFPSEAGLILLDGNYPHAPDVHDQNIGVAAFGWVPCRFGTSGSGWRSRSQPEWEQDSRAGIILTLFSDFADEADDINKQLKMRERELARFPRLSLFHIHPWQLGVNIPDAVDPMWERAAIGTQGVQSTQLFLRTFITLLTLMRQRIAVTSEPALPRQIRRTAARQARTVPALRVVTLRRAYARSAEKSAEAQPVSWSQRWIVSGHWRQQWYASIGAHRQIWIAPFVKGPQDKPLVLPDEVYKLRR